MIRITIQVLFDKLMFRVPVYKFDYGSESYQIPLSTSVVRVSFHNFLVLLCFAVNLRCISNFKYTCSMMDRPLIFSFLIMGFWDYNPYHRYETP
jgi:hypothetical protein